MAAALMPSSGLAASRMGQSLQVPVCVRAKRARLPLTSTGSLAPLSTGPCCLHCFAMGSPTTTANWRRLEPARRPPFEPRAERFALHNPLVSGCRSPGPQSVSLSKESAAAIWGPASESPRNLRLLPEREVWPLVSRNFQPPGSCQLPASST